MNPDIFHQEQQEIHKEQEWKAVEASVDQITDALGKPIEDRIKQPVVALNVYKINTSQSCEGHSNGHGRRYPWVEISAPDEPKERFEGEREIYKKVAAEFGVTEEDVVRGNNEEAWSTALKRIASSGLPETQAYKKWEEENKILHSKLQKLLDSFYKGESLNDDSIKLKIEKWGSEGTSFDLHNVQDDDLKRKFEDEITDEEKQKLAEKLESRIVEMNRFAGFLQRKFLEE